MDTYIHTYIYIVINVVNCYIIVSKIFSICQKYWAKTNISMEKDLSCGIIALCMIGHMCKTLNCNYSCPGLNEEPSPFVVQELACGLLFHWLVSAEGRGQLRLAAEVEEEGAGPKRGQDRRST